MTTPSPSRGGLLLLAFMKRASRRHAWGTCGKGRGGKGILVLKRPRIDGSNAGAHDHAAAGRGGKDAGPGVAARARRLELRRPELGHPVGLLGVASLAAAHPSYGMIEDVVESFGAVLVIPITTASNQKQKQHRRHASRGDEEGDRRRL